MNNANNAHKAAAWLVTVAAVAVGSASVAGELRPVYRIGNSFTWDSQPEDMDQLGRIESGYHVRCGSTLATIAGDRTTCEPATPAVWQDALPLGWSALVVQPFRGADATLASDLAAIDGFLAAAGEPQPELFVYQSWPFRDPNDGKEAWADWLAPLPADGKTRHRQSHFRAVAEAIGATVIPNADVLGWFYANPAALGLANGELLYRDSIHLANVGQAIVGYTAWATITGERTAGLPNPFALGLSAQQTATIQGVVDAVVQGQLDPRSVTLAELHAAWGTWTPGPDLNLDGAVDARDYTAWRDAGGGAVATPEPGGLWAAIAAMVARMFGRKRRSDAVQFNGAKARLADRPLYLSAAVINSVQPMWALPDDAGKCPRCHFWAQGSRPE